MWNRDSAQKSELHALPAAVADAIESTCPDAGRERRVVAWVGKSVVFRGDLISSEDMTIDGRVEGSIEVRNHHLTIGPNASIEADIAARLVTLFGKVSEASRRRSAWRSVRARPWRPITCQTLAIQEGAFFCGKVAMSGRQAKTDKSASEGVATPPRRNNPATATRRRAVLIAAAANFDGDAPVSGRVASIDGHIDAGDPCDGAFGARQALLEPAGLGTEAVAVLGRDAGQCHFRHRLIERVREVLPEVLTAPDDVPIAGHEHAILGEQVDQRRGVAAGRGGAVLLSHGGEIVRRLDHPGSERFVQGRRRGLADRRHRHLAGLDLCADWRPPDGNRTNGGDDKHPVHDDTQLTGRLPVDTQAMFRFRRVFQAISARFSAGAPRRLNKPALPISEW
jgi:cytoskeletal protein CcmA (bactofilin family)